MNNWPFDGTLNCRSFDHETLLPTAIRIIFSSDVVLVDSLNALESQILERANVFDFQDSSVPPGTSELASIASILGDFSKTSLEGETPDHPLRILHP